MAPPCSGISSRAMAEETKPTSSTHRAASKAGNATAKKIEVTCHCHASNKPPSTGLISEPNRPTPSAQPTPVARMNVG
jgi:hypothetical protein